MFKESITYNATDGCLFPGCLYRNNKINKSIVIFVYGNNGNYYKIKYLEKIAIALQNINVDFLSADNRGREQYVTNYKIVDGVKTKIKIGTIYENFNESIFDIKGMVNFAKERGYQKIVLLGESLGSVKVLNYCINNNDVSKIILISPVDMVLRFKARVKDKYDQYIKKAIKLVKSNNPYQMITDEFSALKVATTMCYNNPSDILRLEDDREEYILNYNGEVSVLVGTEDHTSRDFGMEYLNKKLTKRFENSNYNFYSIEGADHLFNGYEDDLANLIVKCVER